MSHEAIRAALLALLVILSNAHESSLFSTPRFVVPLALPFVPSLTPPFVDCVILAPPLLVFDFASFPKSPLATPSPFLYFLQYSPYSSQYAIFPTNFRSSLVTLPPDYCFGYSHS